MKARDTFNDLALLEATDLKAVAMAFSESRDAKLGEPVAVAGYPLQGLVVFEIWTFPPKCAMLLTSSGGTSHGSHCCDVPLLSK